MSTVAKATFSIPKSQFRQILGLQFFIGNPAQAIEVMSGGGLLVVPAAPALKDLPDKPSYREALLNADLTITDSGFMVLFWNLLQRDNIRKTSGLAYLRQLLKEEPFRRPGNTFWIMPNQSSYDINMAWLESQGIVMSRDNAYVAPMYGESIDDPWLIEQLSRRKPHNVVVTLGGGTQERLGLYLKRNLEFRPAIHCIGAALSFLSGDQVRIPVWADTLYLGWLFRCLSEPTRYVSRYWSARKLVTLLLRYRDQLPCDDV